MKYKLQVTSVFEKTFCTYDKHTKQKINLAIMLLEDNPYVGKSLRGNLDAVGQLELAPIVLFT
ncbi:MAG: hypothetical protein FWH37_00890 [Candidatus Bathyarchaeota archaeon]|nr:hypothetical protein [Candidatus Termiticorpusculum sp.]